MLREAEGVDIDAFINDWTPDKLTLCERWWVRRQPFLEERGYMLRPRYRPGWVASWQAEVDDYHDYEDGEILPVRRDVCLRQSSSDNT